MLCSSHSSLVLFLAVILVFCFGHGIHLLGGCCSSLAAVFVGRVVVLRPMGDKDHLALHVRFLLFGIEHFDQLAAGNFRI